MIVQFRNEKVSNHGSIPITIDCNVVAFIVFEEGFHQPIKRIKHLAHAEAVRASKSQEVGREELNGPPNGLLEIVSFLAWGKQNSILVWIGEGNVLVGSISPLLLEMEISVSADAVIALIESRCR
ncbi:hypothetical protein TNCV_4743761 [Trichonephila clavipes]|nr:hypothetical protein TNCV_4743761 [Trichonephila clavipes]